jgi:hypothetical protein
MSHPEFDTVGKPNRTTRPAKGALGRIEKKQPLSLVRERGVCEEEREN